jgi:hypothetical protein
VIRWGASTLLAILAVTGLAVLGARLLGRKHARGSLLVSVIALWMAAFVLWNMAGGLAQHYGLLATYSGQVFALVAVAGGYWHYRTAVTSSRERGLTVFVGVQIAWLVAVLLLNGAFRG